VFQHDLRKNLEISTWRKRQKDLYKDGMILQALRFLQRRVLSSEI
jgi:hypothetical protein